MYNNRCDKEKKISQLRKLKYQERYIIYRQDKIDEYIQKTKTSIKISVFLNIYNYKISGIKKYFFFFIKKNALFVDYNGY